MRKEGGPSVPLGACRPYSAWSVGKGKEGETQAETPQPSLHNHGKKEKKEPTSFVKQRKLSDPLDERRGGRTDMVLPPIPKKEAQAFQDAF